MTNDFWPLRNRSDSAAPACIITVTGFAAYVLERTEWNGWMM